MTQEKSLIGLQMPATAPDSALNKGLGALKSARPGEIAHLGWNLLREDLSLPTRCFVSGEAAAQPGVDAAIHRRLWSEACAAWQDDDGSEAVRDAVAGGAWGITLATAQQTAAAYRHGVRRVLMANQLVGRQNMEIISRLLRDADLIFTAWWIRRNRWNSLEIS